MEMFFAHLMSGWRLGVVATMAIFIVAWGLGWGYLVFGIICLLLGAAIEYHSWPYEPEDEDDPATSTPDS